MPRRGDLKTYDQEDVTVDNTSGGVRLSLAKILGAPGPAKAATLTVETAQIRWKKDKTGTVTATTGGYVANVGSSIFLDNTNDLVNFRAIRTGSTSGKVHAEFHR